MRNRESTAHRFVTRRVLRSLGIGVLVTVMAATSACDTAPDSGASAKPKPGGTLTIILNAQVDHLDPIQVNTATDGNLSRLISRTLTTYKAEPGAAGSEVVGDLATDTGRPSEGNTVWDFTLKRDVKWEDGTPIVCNEIKYGVERTYVDQELWSPGLPYVQQYLKDNANPYKGPFVGGNNEGRGLESVTCVDSRTIRFKLKQPIGDFGYAVTTGIFSPVPLDADSGSKKAYDLKPKSNGPYKIESWGGGEKPLVLVRNNNWVPASDAIRKAYPDKVVVRVEPNPDKATNAMIESRGDDRNAIFLDTDVSATFIQQVINDPTLDGRAIKGTYSAVRYMAINMSNVKDLKCRQAMEYAFNKRKFRAALGGSTQGELATSMQSSQLSSYKAFDLYGTKDTPEGDPDRARALLKEMADAGTPCPGTLGNTQHPVIKVAFRDVQPSKRAAATVLEAFALAGMTVELKPQLSSGYYDPDQTSVTRVPNEFDLIYAGWVADWNNGSAVLPPLFDGDNVGTGLNNFAELNDPEINQMIDDAIAETNVPRQKALWGELDNKIQALAAAIPIIYTSATRMAGTNVRGAYISAYYGQPDVVSLGLADGGATASS